MMSAKMATLGLLKMKLFWNKAYNVIISVNEVSNKILSSGSNLYCRCRYMTKVW